MLSDKIIKAVAAVMGLSCLMIGIEARDISAYAIGFVLTVAGIIGLSIRDE